MLRLKWVLRSLSALSICRSGRLVYDKIMEITAPNGT